MCVGVCLRRCSAPVDGAVFLSVGGPEQQMLYVVEDTVEVSLTDGQS